MSRAFISYSTKDKEYVNNIKKYLKKNDNIDSFWIAEEKVRRGQNWEREISTALRECDYFIIIMSPNAAKSKEVKAEVNYAFRHKSDKIIPIMIKKCDPDSISYKLGSLQYLDIEKVNQANAKEVKEQDLEGYISALITSTTISSILPIPFPTFILAPILYSAIKAKVDTKVDTDE